ncbi:MAG: orotidine 5'-phosphate decarboxylase / HUMPS family protein [Acidimicrobiales bacterium]
MVRGSEGRPRALQAAGPDAIESMVELGYEVFVDLKLHDIPTTVGKASKVLGGLGASYVTMHAFGGVDMLQAGVEGLRAGASEAGLPEPCALAVTILTSDSSTATSCPSRRSPSRPGAAASCGGEDAHEAR